MQNTDRVDDVGAKGFSPVFEPAGCKHCRRLRKMIAIRGNCMRYIDTAAIRRELDLCYCPACGRQLI